MYNAVDAHTHLDFPAFDDDRQQVVDRARQAGVRDFVLAGANPDHWERLEQVASALGAARCLGVHPWWVAGRSSEQLAADMDAITLRDELDGIGETGLDWFRAPEEGPERAAQRAYFAAHVDLAHDLGLPLVLHIVRAHNEALGMLAALDVPAAGGLVHAWSAGPEPVDAAVELGLHLSFGTALTRSGAVREALKRVPDERLLLETDCPDQPLSGQTRGEPVHLVQIAEIAAEIRDTTPEALLTLTGDNARDLFPRLR